MDRADLGNCVMNRARRMHQTKEVDTQRWKRLERSFEGKPPVVQRLETPWSRDVQSVKFMVDSDQDPLLDTLHSLEITS